MKAKPRRFDGTDKYWPCAPKEATHVVINLPGEVGWLMLPVVLGNEDRAGTNCWSWNGNMEKPTLKPSLLTTLRAAKVENSREVEPALRSHVWVNEGMVQFLGDSNVGPSNVTLPLLDVPEWGG